jgi:hypothetical protein
MRRGLQAVAVVLVVLAPTVRPAAQESADESGASGLQIRGRLKQEVAYRLTEPHDFTKIRTLGWLEARYDVSPAVTFRLAGRGWYNAVFDLTDQYPDAVADDERLDWDVRQALVSVSVGGFDVRLGRQQIVWGEAIGTFVTDVVNPKDFREFVLPEFSEIRIPVWALDVSYAFGRSLVVEGVWSPDVTVSKIPKAGAEYEFFRPPPPPGLVLFAGEKVPASKASNSQGGGRVSYLVGGWDVSVLYYDAFDQTPVVFRSQLDPLPDGTPVFVLTQRHPRLHMVGGTLGKSFEPVVVRAEVLYTIGKLYGTDDLADADGVIRRDTLDYLLSLDYTFFDRVATTWQLSQKVLTGSAAGTQRGGVQGQVSSIASLRIATPLFDDRLTFSAIAAVGLDRGDYRVSPKLEYLLTGSVTLGLGADIFGGAADTLFGQFGDTDRIYVEVTYRF